MLVSMKAARPKLDCLDGLPATLYVTAGEAAGVPAGDDEVGAALTEGMVLALMARAKVTQERLKDFISSSYCLSVRTGGWRGKVLMTKEQIRGVSHSHLYRHFEEKYSQEGILDATVQPWVRRQECGVGGAGVECAPGHAADSVGTYFCGVWGGGTESGGQHRTKVHVLAFAVGWHAPSGANNIGQTKHQKMRKVLQQCAAQEVLSVQVR